MARRSYTTLIASSSTSALETILEAERRRRRSRLHRRRLRIFLGLLDTEEVGELAGLVHLGDDVATADELAVDEQLRDRGPVRDLRELLADTRVGEDVHRCVADAE